MSSIEDLSRFIFQSEDLVLILPMKFMSLSKPIENHLCSNLFSRRTALNKPHEGLLEFNINTKDGFLSFY